MFVGTHLPRLDDKGRLFLPARFREQLTGGIVITKGQENCLYGFPAAEFARMAASLSEAPVTTKALRDYSRVFFGSASDETPDRQGRVSIPPGLRSYAGLTRDVAVVGVNNRIEIWDAGAWDRTLASTEPAFSDAREEVLPGVF